MDEASDKDMADHQTLLLGSEMEYDHVCQPCGTAGRNIEAEGYCLDCCVYLCTPCVQYHKTLPALAHHQLADKDNMPQEPGIPQSQDVCKERCLTHKDDTIKYYCHTHKVLGCSACITLQHNSCKDLDYIPEVAPTLQDSSDYMQFQAKLEDLQQKANDAMKENQESLKRSIENYTKVQNEIEDYRQEINKALDRIKDEIKEKLNKLKTEEAEPLKFREAKSNQVLSELKSLSSDIDASLHQKQFCQMFIQMKTTENKLVELQEMIEGLEDTHTSHVIFKPNAEFQKVLRHQDTFGKLITEIPEKASARHVKNINVKSKNNTKNCRITGMAQLTSDLLVIADNTNASIKLVDTTHDKILSETTLNVLPWDVTILERENVAVTAPESKKIMFFHCNDEKMLTYRKEINFKAECWGITSTASQIFVSFYDPQEVRILSVKGKELQKIVKDDRGRKLFKGTQYIALNTISQSICVSDWKQDSLTMLDMNGNVRSVYKDKELTVAKQLAVDHAGRMYLCGKTSNNVHFLSPDCKKLKLLLKKSDGVKNPESVCYCEETGQLYIGAFNSNTVKVYKLE